MTNLSLIISVYKNKRALELIFTALSHQTYKNFEIIIADDGSGQDMIDFIDGFKKSTQLKIKYVTQPDNGFRKNKILNAAVKASGSDYLVFIDGDCIPHTDFINQHYINKKNNTVLTGRRVMLSKKYSDRLNIESIISREYEKIGFKHFLDSLKKEGTGSKFVETGITIKNPLLRKILVNDDNALSGCNFSLPKDLLEKVNGFDENYEGPGFGEDSDLDHRLRLTGAKFISLKNLAILYHLHHKNTSISAKNKLYYKKMIKSGIYFCENGLVKPV